MGLVTLDQVTERSEYPKVHHRVCVSLAQGAGAATQHQRTWAGLSRPPSTPM